ncbi:MAG: chlorophyll synthase ChlG [Pseudomonadota bacterium]
MRYSLTTTFNSRFPASAVVTLLKPITWFPPMWAFACGIVSSGGTLTEHWLLIIAGVILAGPLVCGTSQAVNDWFDRHVDAINEPDRPIPSGQIPGQWGLNIAIICTVISLMFASTLGVWVFAAAIIGLLLAWAYSAPPFRLKQNGWWGNSAVAACYEGLPWFTGAALISATLPDTKIILLAILYSIGAHGIMTLNDFKAIEGDQRLGVRSLPVQLGTNNAARLACIVMAIPQVIIIALLYQWQLDIYAIAVASLLMIQIILMIRFLNRPKELAPWYNTTGITLYVSGMMVSAFAIRGLLII